MQLMRIGPVGAEQPVVRINELEYVNVSDVAGDFDESFFANGGLQSVRAAVAHRIEKGQVEQFAGQRIGTPIAFPNPALGMASLVFECVHDEFLPRLIQPARDPGRNGEPRIVVIRILDSAAEQISPARPASPRERREWLEPEDAFARSTSLDTISGAS